VDGKPQLYYPREKRARQELMSRGGERCVRIVFMCCTALWVCIVAVVSMALL
jgi:hypothetical protein